VFHASPQGAARVTSKLIASLCQLPTVLDDVPKYRLVSGDQVHD
jgi:hypothetical protein